MKKHEYFDGLLRSIRDKDCLATIDNKELLEKIKGKSLVVYFYPKDNTPGCTMESKDFAKNYPEFQKHNTEIIGISRDSVASHAGFRSKKNLTFELISDFNEEICKIFDVLQDGKLIRSTFLYDERGTLIKEWRKVKVLGHVKEVLNLTGGMVDAQ